MERTIKKDLWKVLLAILAFAALMAAQPAQASYEVSNFNMFSTPAIETPSKWTNNLEIRWTAPTMASDYTLNRYIYLWNNVATAMTDTNFDPSTTGAVGTTETAATKQAPDLTAKDFSLNPGADFLYLHVKTEYLETSTNKILYSNDAVLGPFQIDNVAPSGGTIQIVDDSGTVITSTKSPDVKVNLPASGAIGKYYLSESESLSTNEVTPINGGVAWGLSEAKIGSHTLYAWFEDPAGNKSSTPATATVTLLGAVSINPYTAAIDLAVTGATQKFQIDGSAADYTWSITDPKPETLGETVAVISGNSTGNSITVNGLKKGTFKLQAVPTAAGETLTSGTISVVQTSTTKQYNLLAGLNIISPSRTGTGWSKAANLATAVGNSSTSVIKWDASRQGFVAHIKGTPLNNFDLVEGDAYFVNVNAPSTFAVTGQTVVRTFSLVTGLNLIGLPDAKASLTKAANLAADVGTSCVSITKWDASRQGFVAHIKGTPLNNYDVSVGDGYFVNVNANSQW